MYRCSIIARLVGNGATFPRRRIHLLAGPVVLALAVAGSLLLGTSPARAVTIIDWSSTAATNSWNTGTNWVGNTAPANNLTDNIARFNQTFYLNTPLTNVQNINGIQIGDGTTATGPLTLAANSGIGAAGITMYATPAWY
jgi:hypothetical protein